MIFPGNGYLFHHRPTTMTEATYTDQVIKRFSKQESTKRGRARKTRGAMGMAAAKFLEAGYYGTDGLLILQPRGYAQCGKPLVLFGQPLGQFATHEEKKKMILAYVANAIDEGQVHESSYEAYTRLSVNTIPYKTKYKNRAVECIIPTCSSRSNGKDESLHTGEPRPPPPPVFLPTPASPVVPKTFGEYDSPPLISIPDRICQSAAYHSSLSTLFATLAKTVETFAPPTPSD